MIDDIDSIIKAKAKIAELEEDNEKLIRMKNRLVEINNMFNIETKKYDNSKYKDIILELDKRKCFIYDDIIHIIDYQLKHSKDLIDEFNENFINKGGHYGNKDGSNIL